MSSRKTSDKIFFIWGASWSNGLSIGLWHQGSTVRVPFSAEYIFLLLAMMRVLARVKYDYETKRRSSQQDVTEDVKTWHTPAGGSGREQHKKAWAARSWFESGKRTCSQTNIYFQYMFEKERWREHAKLPWRWRWIPRINNIKNE